MGINLISSLKCHLVAAHMALLDCVTRKTHPSSRPIILALTEMPFCLLDVSVSLMPAWHISHKCLSRGESLVINTEQITRGHTGEGPGDEFVCWVANKGLKHFFVALSLHSLRLKFFPEIFVCFFPPFSFPSLTPVITSSRK